MAIQRAPMPQPSGEFYARSKDHNSPPGTGQCDPAIMRRSNPNREANQYGLEFLRRKKIIQPFTYTPNVAQPFALAAGGTATMSFVIDKEADFELHKIACVVDVPALGIVNGRGDDFTFRILDSRRQIYFSNNPIHNLCGTGSGIFPLCLPETRMFKASTNVQVEVVNRRATPINLWMEFHGLNFYSREFQNLTDIPDFSRLSDQAKRFFVADSKKYIDPHFLTLDGGMLAILGGQTLTDQVISIRQEGDFEAFAITAFSLFPFSFRMRRGGTGRIFSPFFVTSGAACGDGERPFLFPEPIWLDANSQLFIDFTNSNAVVANQIFFTLIGRKWFDSASLNLTAGPSFYMDKLNQFSPDGE